MISTGGAWSADDTISRATVSSDASSPGKADFEGGKGVYRLPNGTSINDECRAEVLLMTDDGRSVKLRAQNTVDDNNPEKHPHKKPREQSWVDWLAEVRSKSENR